MTERLLLTLWVGSLWAIGFLAAPVLFSQLNDRSLAGTLAGEMFRATAYIGLVCGVGLLILQFLGDKAPRWRFWVILGMLLLVAAGQFLLAPMMADLRASGVATGAEFARLHGVASTIHLLLSLLGLGLVIGSDQRIQR